MVVSPARSARSLRSLAHPCATLGVRPLSAPHSLCSGGGSGPRVSPVATRRPRPAASLCPVGARSCAPPRCGSPLGGRCPCGACGSRLGLPPFPAGTLGRAPAWGCAPLPRVPPLLGAARPLSPSLSSLGVRIRPARHAPAHSPLPPRAPRGGFQSVRPFFVGYRFDAKKAHLSCAIYLCLTGCNG